MNVEPTRTKTRRVKRSSRRSRITAGRFQQTPTATCQIKHPYIIFQSTCVIPCLKLFREIEAVVSITCARKTSWSNIFVSAVDNTKPTSEKNQISIIICCYTVTKSLTWCYSANALERDEEEDECVEHIVCRFLSVSMSRRFFLEFF